eukprot:7382126-Prymnesium_polylepis.2
MVEMKAIAWARFAGTKLVGDKAAHAAVMTRLVAAQPSILALPRTPTAATLAVAAAPPPVDAGGVAAPAAVPLAVDA